MSACYLWSCREQKLPFDTQQPSKAAHLFNWYTAKFLYSAPYSYSAKLALLALVQASRASYQQQAESKQWAAQCCHIMLNSSNRANLKHFTAHGYLQVSDKPRTKCASINPYSTKVACLNLTKNGDFAEKFFIHFAFTNCTALQKNTSFCRRMAVYRQYSLHKQNYMLAKTFLFSTI